MTDPLPSDYSRVDRCLYWASQRRIPISFIAAILASQIVGAVVRQLFHRAGLGAVLIVETPFCALAGYLIADAQIRWQRRRHLGPCLKNLDGKGGCYRPGRWALHIEVPPHWQTADLPPQTGCWCDRHAPAVLAEWAALPGSDMLRELRLVPFVDRHRT